MINDDFRNNGEWRDCINNMQVDAKTVAERVCVQLSEYAKANGYDTKTFIRHTLNESMKINSMKR